MHQKTIEYVQRNTRNKQLIHRLCSVVAILSLIVVCAVFWYLKLTGVTLAGEAFCGMAEHVHDESCVNCTLVEHIHDKTCYSDITADLETSDDWELTFADVERGSTTGQTLVRVAQSQLGYTESQRNFEVGADGTRRGITRYGQWYGNPYGDWSAMFASFCLYYAGAEDLPSNAGSESMRLQWEAEGYYVAAEEYSPQVGNLLFLREGADHTTANAVAIITEVSQDAITVVQGDADNTVSEVVYSIDHPRILGYGLVPDVSDFAVFVETPETLSSLAATAKFANSMLTSSNRFVLYYVHDGQAYAIDGTGNAVAVEVGSDGKIRSETDNPDSLMWTFARYNNSTTAIQNVGTGRYLRPYYTSDTDNGLTAAGRGGTTVSASGNGAKLNSSAYIAFDGDSGQFVLSRTQSENITLLIGQGTPCTVWLDGTCGTLMSLGGSDNTGYTMYTDSTLTLPTAWKSPVKYAYVINGWYDITNNKYYQPGDKVTVTGNMVFYADWKAASYDVGEFNEFVDDRTLDTNDFITTRVFDYSILFNILSERVSFDKLDSSGHTETWSMITSGDNLYNGEDTLNYIFRDWDSPGEFSWPNGADEGTPNYPPADGGVTMGLYTETIRELLFNPEVQTLGKTYLGEGNYLFQLCQNPDHNHHGDYYYNSERNAASYNQTDQRFYVYDYLECTRTSSNQSDEGKYSDFLPFNSPYANTNGQTVNTYQFAGTDNQYIGTTHYMYDCRYDDSDNRTDLMGTNFLFGMSVDIRFYLPNQPGTKLLDGHYGNIDIYGDQMHFRFAGDDDVWVFVDGVMVLDLGGLHGRESGEINFSTGEVTIDGVVHKEFSDAIKKLMTGEHNLTMYYLERGSSMSNCSIYFNLAPRYDFTIYKEDVITGEALNGSEFSVYTDQACTIPAQLWNSYEEKVNGAPATNVFKVVDGKAHMWGISSGNTYYIRETKPPDGENYGMPHGIICLTFVRKDVYSYHAEVLPESGMVSPGFTIFEFRVDNDTLQSYIHISNGADWIQETTTVTVRKRWADDKNHDEHMVTVYLTITDKDGTVRRLQEERLYSENDWQVVWENLPKYWEDGVTPIQYGIEEAYSAGYYGHVEEADGEFVLTHADWVYTTQNQTPFEDGKEYILSNGSGQYLSTREYAADTGFKWVSEEEAKTSDLALWTASVKNNTVRFTNRRGQTFSFWYGNGSPTDFFAKTEQGEDNNTKQYFSFKLVTVRSETGLALYYNNRYLSPNLNSSNKFNPTNANDQNAALLLYPRTLVNITERIPLEDGGFMLTNKPLDKETSVTVRKEWVIPPEMDESIYEQKMVTVKLFANDRDTGRTITLTLKNGWQDTFYGLPYEDENGIPIVYTVVEVWEDERWTVDYGTMTPSGGEIPIYGTVITNTYHLGGPPLPTTGSPARLLYTLCGAFLMLVPLVIGIGLRRKRERRLE